MNQRDNFRKVCHFSTSYTLLFSYLSFKIINCDILDKISGKTPFTRRTILTTCNIFSACYTVFSWFLSIKRQKGRFETKLGEKSDIPKLEFLHNVTFYPLGT